MRIAVYPGTFDPITAGHLDIILRSLRLVDKLYIAIALDSTKAALFSAPERMAMIQAELEAYDVPKNLVAIETFSGLLVNFAKERSITTSIRGLRTLADFDYEFQMACMNTMLDPDIQTIFLPASTKLQLVSSKLVKEVTKLGGNTGEFLSDRVKAKLKDKLET